MTGTAVIVATETETTEAVGTEIVVIATAVIVAVAIVIAVIVAEVAAVGGVVAMSGTVDAIDGAIAISRDRTRRRRIHRRQWTMGPLREGTAAVDAPNVVVVEAVHPPVVVEEEGRPLAVAEVVGERSTGRSRATMRRIRSRVRAQRSAVTMRRMDRRRTELSDRSGAGEEGIETRRTVLQREGHRLRNEEEGDWMMQQNEVYDELTMN